MAFQLFVSVDACKCVRVCVYVWVGSVSVSCLNLASNWLKHIVHLYLANVITKIATHNKIESAPAGRLKELQVSDKEFIKAEEMHR